MHNDGTTRRIAVVYAARSRPDETGSIEDQLRACRAWAANGDQGREVYEPEFSDEARSAYSGSRGDGLVAAKAAAAALSAAGHDVVLVATETDRFARGDGREAAHLVDHVLEAIRAGYRLESVNEDIGGEMALVLAALYGSRNHKDSK